MIGVDGSEDRARGDGEGGYAEGLEFEAEGVGVGVERGFGCVVGAWIGMMSVECGLSVG